MKQSSAQEIQIVSLSLRENKQDMTGNMCMQMMNQARWVVDSSQTREPEVIANIEGTLKTMPIASLFEQLPTKYVVYFGPIFCTKCAKKLLDDATFCGHCGRRIKRELWVSDMEVNVIHRKKD